MAEIDNGFGESIPDEVAVSLVYNRETRELIDCDAPRGDWPDAWQARAITAWTEMWYDSNVCVARGAIDSDQYNTLAHNQPTFVYLDCGRWGGNLPGGQRTFGLVWGRWAVLCKYIPHGGAAVTVHPNTEPLNNLIASLTSSDSSIEVIKKVWSPGVVEPDWNGIYVFIPDLHLPIVTGFPHSQEYIGGPQGRTWREYVSDGPAMGRYQYRAPRSDREGMINGVDGRRVLGTEGIQWFHRYLAGDIFQGAARDLIRFVTLLGRSPLRSRIHLVQLGDMYDLWIGLERFFSEQTGFVVDLANRGSLQARTFINYWVERTDQAFPDMIRTLTGVRVAEKSWLWGNHDNYLAAHTPPGLPRRVKQIRHNGIFVEHGHRGDDANRDGAVSGQSFTNRVFEHPSLRAWDPNRRDYFTTTAALSYVSHPDFCVYVMGHTHSPFLTKVRLDLSMRIVPDFEGMETAY